MRGPENTISGPQNFLGDGEGILLGLCLLAPSLLQWVLVLDMRYEILPTQKVLLSGAPDFSGRVGRGGEAWQAMQANHSQQK